MINCQIAKVNFSFNCLSELMNKQLKKYETEKQGDFIISCEIVKKIQIPNINPKYHSKYYDIYENGEELIQIQKSENDTYIGTIIYRSNFARILMEEDNLTRKEYLLTQYAAVYFILKEQPAIYIHSSSIEYLDQGLLFIASSGVGKSTQARLWKEHLNITQINDDKNIIIEENDGLYIYGNPWSGKSLIDVNKRIKLSDLIFVNRSEEPSVKLITKKEQFLYLLPHITNSSFMFDRNKWDHLTDKLMEVDAVILNCNVSYQSVDILKKYLEEKNENQ